MNKIKRLLIVSALTVALSGCTTTPTGQNVPNVQAMTMAAQSAAFLGTTIYLQGFQGVPAHPQARPQFITARDSLRALIAAGSFSAADLTEALQALPVKALQGDQGTLIVGEAVMLWNQYGQQLATLDKNQVFATYILPVAKAILAGLDQALGPLQTSAEQDWMHALTQMENDYWESPTTHQLLREFLNL